MSTAARVEFAHPAPRRIARAQNCAQTWSVCTIIGSLVGVVASGLGGARTDWRTVHGGGSLCRSGEGAEPAAASPPGRYRRVHGGIGRRGYLGRAEPRSSRSTEVRFERAFVTEDRLHVPRSREMTPLPIFEPAAPTFEQGREARNERKQRATCAPTARCRARGAARGGPASRRRRRRTARCCACATSARARAPPTSARPTSRPTE